LDPSLQLFTGVQYPAADKAGFGMFMDPAPDRWGTMLMQRREARSARDEGRAARALSPSDLLLGVSDRSRMGALRFALDPEGPYLAADTAKGIPPMTRLRTLEKAARDLENGDLPQKEQDQMLDLLLAPGSSLGGARPKASVVDQKGNLWIAKFPSRGDEVDKGAWEWVVHQLAQHCGVAVAVARAERFSKNGHTFLTKRFDRNEEGDRIHFVSAMTMTGHADGDDAHSGASYLELVEFLMRHGSRTQADLAQLWDRIAFSICVSNTDDHLRNHGFLLGPDGWWLSPAFDLNPEPSGHGLSLNIDEHDNSLSLSVAIDAAPLFRLKKELAAKRARKIATAVKQWKKPAAAIGIGRVAMERMEIAFAPKP